MRGVVRALAGATGGERLCEPILGTLVDWYRPSDIDSIWSQSLKFVFDFFPPLVTIQLSGTQVPQVGSSEGTVVGFRQDGLA